MLCTFSPALIIKVHVHLLNLGYFYVIHYFKKINEGVGKIAKNLAAGFVRSILYNLLCNIYTNTLYA